MPEDDEECALALNGKISNLRKKDFIAYAKACDISEASAEKMIPTVYGKKKWSYMIQTIFAYS